MIEFYNYPTPNGQKILLALEEMELAFEQKEVNILKGEQNEPGFAAVHPWRKIPAIIDRDGPNGNPHRVFESNAILLYLAQKSGRFWPDDLAEQSTITQWLIFQGSSVAPIFAQCGFFAGGYADEKVPFAIDHYCGQTKKLYHFIDNRLAECEFIAGADYSLADIALYPWMAEHLRSVHGVELNELPHISRWIEEISARPATRRAGHYIQ